MADYDQISKDPSESNFVEGLYIKNGRLINERPEPISGIAKAAMLRKAMKSRTETQNIADGIELYEQRKEMSKIFKGL